MSQSYCNVKNCRFPSTHITRSHKCGTCGKYGHGIMECDNQYMIDKLKSNSSNYFPDNLHCKSSVCPCPWTHTNDAHYCLKCHERHLESVCKKDVIDEATDIFGSTPGKIFTTVYAGLGCSWFVKRNGIEDKISMFFMHTDSWGQYGSHCDDRDKLRNFCEGYRNIESGEFLKI